MRTAALCTRSCIQTRIRYLMKYAFAAGDQAPPGDRIRTTQYLEIYAVQLYMWPRALTGASAPCMAPQQCHGNIN